MKKLFFFKLIDVEVFWEYALIDKYIANFTIWITDLKKYIYILHLIDDNFQDCFGEK